MEAMANLNTLLVFSYATAALVDIGAPLALAWVLAHRYQARWRFWLIGLLVFLLFQGITRVPIMLFVQSRPSMREALQEPAWFWLFLFVAAATAGLFEEGGRWLAYRFLIPREEHRWRTGLMLGAGHGGLEAIAIGLVILAMLIGYVVVTWIPAQDLRGYTKQVAEVKDYFARLQGWEPFLGAWERLGALVIQLGLSVTVLQAFLRGPRWWWYALTAHTIVDFTTVALVRVGTPRWGQTAALVGTEGLVTVYALLSLWLIAALRPKQIPSGSEMVGED